MRPPTIATKQSTSPWLRSPAPCRRSTARAEHLLRVRVRLGGWLEVRDRALEEQLATSDVVTAKFTNAFMKALTAARASPGSFTASSCSSSWRLPSANIAS
jgi:hypothetical protein